jgi:hypothetical protein
MEKRSYPERKSERVKVSEEKVEEVRPKKTKKAPETVRLVLLKELNLNATGPVTGKRYRFSGAGAEVNVDKTDADVMLARRGGECCPGSVGPQPYFALV